MTAMATAGQFRRDRQTPPRTFYEGELGKISRANSKGWALASCPFHQSKRGKSLAVNLDTGAWCCFAGCGKGDQISFVMKRYGLKFKAAAEYLGAWDAVNGTRFQEIRQQQRLRAQQQAEAEAEVERQRQERIAARDHLLLLERVHRDANIRLSEIRKGAPEKYPTESEVLWSILADSLDLSRTAAMEYAQLAGVPAAL